VPSRYQARASAGTDFARTDDKQNAAIAAPFDVTIDAVRSGRQMLVRLHRSGDIDDETLCDLEHIAAQRAILPPFLVRRSGLHEVTSWCLGM
jgi:hypothetical protein